MHELTTKTILLAVALTIGGLMLAFRTQLMVGRLELAATVLHYVVQQEQR